VSNENRMTLKVSCLAVLLYLVSTSAAGRPRVRSATA
jgi:hypothetical protein